MRCLITLFDERKQTHDLICDDRLDFDAYAENIKNMTDEEFQLHLKELGDVSASEMVVRLNQGETIMCCSCGKGKYVAPEGALGRSRSFRCDMCGVFLHITPEFAVE